MIQFHYTVFLAFTFSLLGQTIARAQQISNQNVTNNAGLTLNHSSETIFLNAGGPYSIINDGVITSNSSTAIYTTIQTDITNNGLIEIDLTSGANPRAIFFNNASGTNSLNNLGTINAGTDNGNQARTILANNSIFSDIINSGSFIADGDTQVATLQIYGNTIVGTTDNSGSFSSSAEDRGFLVRLRNTSNIDNFINSGTMSSSVTQVGYGFYLESSSSINTLSNSGSISVSGGTTSRGIFGNGTASSIGTINNSGTITTSGNKAETLLFKGTVGVINNSGTMNANAVNGQGIGMQLFDGSSAHQIDNNGSITATGNSAQTFQFLSSVGDITNRGTLIADSTGNGDKVVFYLNGDAINNITNTSSGTIESKGNGSGDSYGVHVFNASGEITNFSNAGTLTSTGGGNSYGIFSDDGSVGIHDINNSGIIIAEGATTTKAIHWGGSTLSTLTNSGDINSTSIGGDATGIYWSNGSILTNSGTINATASSGTGTGLRVQNSPTTLTNWGTITGSSDGIYLDSSASIIDFLNTGTVSGTSGSGIINDGIITNFTNSQNDLTFTGNLPSNYLILINSSSDYGKTNFSSVSGTLNFGFDDSAKTDTGIYDDVLSGLSTSNINNLSGDYSYNSTYYRYILESSDDSAWRLRLANTRDINQTGENISDLFDAGGMVLNSIFAGGELFIDQNLTLAQNPIFSIRTGSGNAKLNVASDRYIIGSQFTDEVGSVGVLEKTGAGTLVLLNTSNDYTGGTIVSGGVLEIASDLVLGDAASVLTLDGGILAVTENETTNRSVTLGISDGTLNVGSTKTLNLVSAITGMGGLTKEGIGTLTLSGANTYTGSTVVSAGTLDVTGSLASSDITVSVGGTLEVDGASLDDANSVVNLDGTMILEGSETIGSLTGSGTLTNGGFRLTTGGDDTSTTFSGIATGMGGLTKEGIGTLTLSGANTYTGSTVVSAGTLDVTGSLASSDITVSVGGTLEVDGASLDDANSVVNLDGTMILEGSETIGSLTGSGTLTNGGFRLTTGGDDTSTTFSGIATGMGGLTKEGIGTLTLSGTNTYTGSTVVSAGTLDVTGSLASSDITVSVGGTLEVDGASLDDANSVVNLDGTMILEGSETIGSLAGSGTLTNGGFRLTTGGDDTSTTFSGIATGMGGLTKEGIGTLTLSGANTYTGSTVVSAGTLDVTGSLASSDITVSVGGTLEVDGASLDDANSVVNLDGTMILEGSETIGSLTGSGTLTNGGFRLTTGGDDTSTTFSGIATGMGGLTKEGIGTLTLSGANTYTGSTVVSAGTLDVTGSLASSDITVSVGGTLEVDGASLDDANSVVNLDGTMILEGSETIGSLTGSGTLTNGGFRLTTGGDDTSTTFSGIATGMGGLTKEGIGTLTLSGTNTYTGSTVVSAGTLDVTGSLASSDITVSVGGTLRWTGHLWTMLIPWLTWMVQ